MFFKKRNTISEEEKNILKQILYFYETTKDKINYDYNSMSNRNAKIKEIYEILGYNNPPIIEEQTNELKTVYRGISAPDKDTLKEYINQFICGDNFLGGRASIYGTGIYTFTNKNENTESYANDGGLSENGIVLEINVPNDEKIISYENLSKIQQSLLPRLNKLIDNSKFIELLDNCGALGAILNYDAIYVNEKDYLVILNRSKINLNKNYVNNILASSENIHSSVR